MVLDASWQLLDETEREGVRELSVFRGGFTGAAAGQVANVFWSPVVSSASVARQLHPARSLFSGLVSRGEDITRRWVERGQAEEDRSRRLAQTAVQNSFDSVMDQLGQAPALEELIRRQSAGLTQSVMDEGRARTVSGDLIAEHFVRSLFRRQPRGELEEPLVVDDPNSQPDIE